VPSAGGERAGRRCQRRCSGVATREGFRPRTGLGRPGGRGRARGDGAHQVRLARQPGNGGVEVLVAGVGLPVSHCVVVQRPGCSEGRSRISASPRSRGVGEPAPTVRTERTSVPPAFEHHRPAHGGQERLRAVGGVPVPVGHRCRWTRGCSRCRDTDEELVRGGIETEEQLLGNGSGSRVPGRDRSGTTPIPRGGADWKPDGAFPAGPPLGPYCVPEAAIKHHFGPVCTPGLAVALCSPRR
jgi:hypothetical protein